MRMKRLSLLLLLWLCSCSYAPYQEDAQPVSERDAVVSLFQQGQEHAQQGEWGLAQDSFERGLRIEPNNASLWFELAQIAYQQHKPAEARELALRAQTFVEGDEVLTRKIKKLLARVN